MKTTLRSIVALVVMSYVFMATTAWARTPEDSPDAVLSQKAVSLTVMACNIYPAITDDDVCVDKVVRKILSDRNMSSDRQEEVLRELEQTFAARHPQQFGENMTAQQIHLSALVFKLFDVIQLSCVIEPQIVDFKTCMNGVYHSILSSRDPHSGYMNEEESAAFMKSMSGDMQGIGVHFGFTDERAIGVVHVMEGSPAEKAGVKDGDRIVAIVNGNKRVLTTSLPDMEAAIGQIAGKPNTPVILEILRGDKDQLLTITVVRASIKVPMVKTRILRMPNDPNAKYAYVELVQFGTALRSKMVESVKQMLARHSGVKGIIFDVRNNPGGLLTEAYEAVDAIADSTDPLVSIRDNNGVHAYGTVAGERIPEPQRGDITNGLACAVLINGSSASAAEIFAGDLKKLGRCVIIGKGTWRKGSMQNIGPFGDGSYVRLNEAEYLLGSPTSYVAVQCKGIDPDIDYDIEGVIDQKKDIHECDLDGAIVSGGASSDPSATRAPLIERDPALYLFGEKARDAVKAMDHVEYLRLERVKKVLKMSDKEPKASQKAGK
ncbi:MAG: hypothetical protein A2845_03080 [Candidatus Lloydbacteria bacterium RIFCSPHIGHO2_01_FULL_49_22]|uniref:PDZ domain-containing protein n=1 Tax=Candidatus Lloydbacteria bacterium RIFCSPHIGHO2_01_FULL_49_22 TaxID=1798658 RepID=A0A1G2CX51_9BACT|nr:MAG: hypothetical protein A2845_03080 [Candidatus Lloydbacteria bacterium RIFCSPHIGHO2_01_FULL_49_22]OGZ10421.1 MAG: hypothetical protein A3C14_02775 [Candidatus Lloydbacteria bacterium RIFCSPHIGHO2_02_FULL_50_18]